jgi:hypothetical protein
MARVLIIDVSVHGNISTVFERFQGLGKHINGFEGIGNMSTQFTTFPVEAAAMPFHNFLVRFSFSSIS